MAQSILIIDDEAGVRELLADALKLAGFETLTAADAMIALTMLRTTKPDLLIVDINMPLMDGFEFIERIRSNGGVFTLCILDLPLVETVAVSKLESSTTF